MIENIKISSERYVYFDENGTIIKILNYKETDDTYIKVEYSEVEDMLSGKKAFFNFIVIYDPEASSYALKERITNENFTFNASEYIYEIPKCHEDAADMIIVQDLKEKKWKIKLRPLLRDQLKLQQMSVSVPMIISITKSGNPHILYRMMSVSFDEILYNDNEFCINFQYDTEETENLSIYTIKKFKNIQT